MTRNLARRLGLEVTVMSVLDETSRLFYRLHLGTEIIRTWYAPTMGIWRCNVDGITLPADKLFWYLGQN